MLRKACKKDGLLGKGILKEQTTVSLETMHE